MSDGGAFVCQVCGGGAIRVVRTLPALDVEAVRRRRECAECGARFWTRESRESATCSAHDARTIAHTGVEVTR